jgi:hypothetical protein
MINRSSPLILISLPDHLPNRMRAGLDVERLDLAGPITRASANCDDLALGRLFLGCVGNDDAAFGLFLGFDPANENAIMKRSERHVFLR